MFFLLPPGDKIISDGTDSNGRSHGTLSTEDQPGSNILNPDPSPNDLDLGLMFDRPLLPPAEATFDPLRFLEPADSEASEQARAADVRAMIAQHVGGSQSDNVSPSGSSVAGVLGGQRLHSKWNAATPTAVNSSSPSETSSSSLREAFNSTDPPDPDPPFSAPQQRLRWAESLSAHFEAPSAVQSDQSSEGASATSVGSTNLPARSPFHGSGPESWPFDADTAGAEVLTLWLWGEHRATAVREPLVCPLPKASPPGHSPASDGPRSSLWMRAEEALESLREAASTMTFGDMRGSSEARGHAVGDLKPPRGGREMHSSRRIKVVVDGVLVAGISDDAVLDATGETAASALL